MLKNRVEKGVFKSNHNPYRNPWFLVKKKEKGKYRLINTAMEINRVIVKDANLPPFVDEFSKKFIGCIIISLIDFFSGYD